MKETNRLEFLALLAKDANEVLDIGCDHGYFLKILFDKYNLKKGIAIDNKVQPLENAKRNLKGYNCDFILSNGFEEVSTDFKVCNISGVGGITAIDILKLAKPGKYIVSVHSKLTELKQFLNEKGFWLLDEYIVFDKGVYYNVLVLNLKNEKPETTFDCFYSPFILNKKGYETYFLELKEKCEKILRFRPNDEKTLLELKYTDLYLSKHLK